MTWSQSFYGRATVAVRSEGVLSGGRVFVNRCRCLKWATLGDYWSAIGRAHHGFWIWLLPSLLLRLRLSTLGRLHFLPRPDHPRLMGEREAVHIDSTALRTRLACVKTGRPRSSCLCTIPPIAKTVLLAASLHASKQGKSAIKPRRRHTRISHMLYLCS